jgi:hypothetical protein
MEIFPEEINDGLQEVITAKACVSYATQAVPCDDQQIKGKKLKSLASVSDEDLYYVQSILVSSSWNKNDDIFDKAEVWEAKSTPEDKPTNLEHDEATIIGHIVSNYPITEDGILIDENTPVENLPDKYHILTGSVIYKGFSNPELRSRSEKLIAEIESGEKYVSMECFFKGFDYGLINKANNNYTILPRNKETAHLTKHLRAYGGQGEHEGFRIGRVLRGITFSGKGFVNKPANPDSIIFTKNSLHNIEEEKVIEKNTNLCIAGVSDNQSTFNSENHIMSEQTVTTELQEKVESASDCLEAVKEAEASSNELKEKANELETALKTSETSLAEVQSQLQLVLSEKEEAAKKWDMDMKKKEEEMKKMKAELDEALESIAAYKNKEAEMLKKEKKMKRMASLLEVGVDNDTASAAVEKFENLEDEAFEAVKSLLLSKSASTSTVTEEVTATESTDTSEVVETADASVLDNVEVTEEVNLGVGGDSDNAIESTRAALVEYVYSRIGKKHNN